MHRLTSTDREDEKTNDERCSSMTSLKNTWNGTNNHNDVSETTDEHTYKNGWVTANLRIRNPSAEDWSRIRKKFE
jgi:hypothetical protein